MRFYVPFSVCRLRCAVTRGGQPRTVPLRRSIVRSLRCTIARASAIAGGFARSADRAHECRESISSLWFWICVLRLACCAVCGTRRWDHHGSRRFDRVMRRGLSSARRSATRALSNPVTTGPHTRISLVARVVRQRSWDFRTLRSVPRPRVPAFVMRRARSSLRTFISAVHPHLPLSNSHRAVYFYSCRSRASESVKRLLPHTSE